MERDDRHADICLSSGLAQKGSGELLGRKGPQVVGAFADAENLSGRGRPARASAMAHTTPPFAVPSSL